MGACLLRFSMIPLRPRRTGLPVRLLLLPILVVSGGDGAEAKPTFRSPGYILRHIQVSQDFAKASVFFPRGSVRGLANASCRVLGSPLHPVAPPLWLIATGALQHPPCPTRDLRRVFSFKKERKKKKKLELINKCEVN